MNQTSQKENVRLALFLPRTFFSSDERISFAIDVTNMGADTLPFALVHFLKNFNIVLRNSEGIQFIKPDIQKQINEIRNSEFVQRTVVNIPSGKQHSFSSPIDLNNIFSLSPGRYQLQAELLMGLQTDMIIRSEAIEFTIT